MASLTSRADFLASTIMAMSGGQKFVLLSKTAGNGLPLVTWRLKNRESYDGQLDYLALFRLQCRED